MDHSKFKETENKYMELKSMLDSGSISSEELKLKLKKMMIRDEDGNYWMIGSNTGKWYIYNGTDWKEKDPYHGAELSKTQSFNNLSSETVVVHHNDEAEEENEIKLEHQDAEQENEAFVLEQKEEEVIVETDDYSSKTFGSGEQEESEREAGVSGTGPAGVSRSSSASDPSMLCIICKSRIDDHSVYCSYCGANQKELSSKKNKPDEELLIRSFRVSSLVFFFGGLGLIAGVIFGATFGIFDILPDLLAKFPEMLAEYRGKLQGGLIFAALGGIGGFFSFAIFFGAAGMIYNAFSYLFGGIRIGTR